MVRGRPFQRSLARLVRGGVISRPAWLATVEKVPPHFAAVESRKPPRLVYPEDRMRHAFLRKNPEARRDPIDLKARRRADAHTADAFVALQMRAMRERGLSEAEAYDYARDEFKDSQARGKRRVSALHEAFRSDVADPRDRAKNVYIASLHDAEADKKILEALREESGREQRSKQSHENEVREG